mgnify:CR=1 FL=1
MAATVAGPAPADGVLGLDGLRLTARGRFVLALAALLLAAPLGLWGVSAVAGSPHEPVPVQLHTVAPGETLWQYAEQVAGPDQDLRDVVADLRDLNGLRSSELRVGQLVVLPRE